MPLSQQLGFPKVVEIRNEDGSLNRDPYAMMEVQCDQYTCHILRNKLHPRDSRAGGQHQALRLLGASRSCHLISLLLTP